MESTSQAKVGIPRLPNGSEPSTRQTQTFAKNRTSRACNLCRKGRFKCTGGLPCQRCGEKHLECAYGDRKKERDRKYVERLQHRNEELAGRNHEYLEMLRPLSGNLALPLAERGALAELVAKYQDSYEEDSPSSPSAAPLSAARSEVEGDFPGIPGTSSSAWASNTGTLGHRTEFEGLGSRWSATPHTPEDQGERDHPMSDIQDRDTSDWERNTEERSALRHPNHFTSATQSQLTGGDFVTDDSVPIESWVNVTSNADLIIHLLSLYFCWEYPTFASLSKEHFIADFYQGKERYCSSLLVNAILALGAKFSDLPEARMYPDDPDTAGDHFFEECKRLFGSEELPSLPTTQALGLMALRQASRGKDQSSWNYARQSMRMAIDLGLHLDNEEHKIPGAPFSKIDLEVRAATFWGCFNLEQAWSMCIGRSPQMDRHEIHIEKPSVIEEIDQQEWVPYTDDGQPLEHEARQPSNIRAVYRSFSELSEIVHDCLIKLYSPSRRMTSKTVLGLYMRYLEWYNDLPGHLKLGLNFTPPVLFTNMYYHFAIILLFRPFLNLRFVGSSISARLICSQAAETLTSLIGSYRQLYSLRRTPSFMPYMVLTSNIALLVDQKLHNITTGENNAAYRLNGLHDLLELSVAHGAARKFVDILRYFGQDWDMAISDDPTEALAHRERGRSSPMPHLGTFFLPEPAKYFVPTGADKDSKDDDRIDLTSFMQNIVFRTFPNQGLPSVHGAVLSNDRDERRDDPEREAQEAHLSREASTAYQTIVNDLKTDGFYGAYLARTP